MSFFDRKKKDNDDNYSDLNNPSYQNPQPQSDQNSFDQAQNQFNNAPGMGMQYAPNGQDFNNGMNGMNTNNNNNGVNGNESMPNDNNNNYFFDQNQPQANPQAQPQNPQPQQQDQSQVVQDQQQPQQAPQQPVMDNGDNDEWKYTEQNLQSTLNQSADLKAQLRSQLLADRSYCNHVLRNTGSDQTETRKQATDRISSINASLKDWFGTDEMANEIYLDTDRDYYVFSDDIAANPDSLVTSMWQQLTKTLQEKGLLANTISVTYNDQVDQTWMNYQNAGFVDGNSFLLNMYNELQGRNSNVTVAPAEIPFDENYRVQHVSDKVDKILNADDKLIMEVSRSANHQLQIIRHYKNNNLLSRDIFDVNGVISATQFYDHRNANKVVRENFYRQDGTLVLIKSYTADEPYIQLFSEGNVLISTFDSDEELIVWWIKNRALKQSEATIFISINSKYYKRILSLRDYGYEVIPIVMKQSENSEAVSNLIEGKDKVTAVMAGSDQVNTYLNKNSKNKLDITTLKEIETPIYKQ
ncbi:hypothetical protein FD29_GL000466 [Companilactobacillus mindensis DSM 14500]|uniref:Uncharacterized protein n=1 Tax=Companilactobacillus mindensis DSM 14500 TaxID=1423770 RepID=A0A0R1QGH2_9LACO|nr:hypothetical protein [Companilactobacillus mindensis]KRL43901.1 hypothetical protein FD29_GL000466 [Companilactobacillus mindensis DSM 14500]GEO79217.1 hypothetical protein LMI01_15480 [Companilactobacillus mindensis]